MEEYKFKDWLPTELKEALTPILNSSGDIIGIERTKIMEFEEFKKIFVESKQ